MSKISANEAQWRNINTLTLQELLTELLKGLCHEMNMLLIYKVKSVLRLMDLTNFAALLMRKLNIKVFCLYENRLLTMNNILNEPSSETMLQLSETHL